MPRTITIEQAVGPGVMRTTLRADPDPRAVVRWACSSAPPPAACIAARPAAALSAAAQLLPCGLAAQPGRAGRACLPDPDTPRQKALRPRSAVAVASLLRGCWNVHSSNRLLQPRRARRGRRLRWRGALRTGAGMRGVPADLRYRSR